MLSAFSASSASEFPLRDVQHLSGQYSFDAHLHRLRAYNDLGEGEIPWKIAQNLRWAGPVQQW